MEDGSPRRLLLLEVAAWFRVTEDLISAWVEAGKIPHRVIGPDLLRFDIGDLDEWSRQKRLTARPDKPRGAGGASRGGQRARLRALHEEASAKAAATESNTRTAATEAAGDGEPPCSASS